jgi:sugar lactone lactonase YvrE
MNLIRTNAPRLIALLLAAMLAACGVKTTPPAGPTPNVPNLYEIDGAIQKWAASNNLNYVAFIEETSEAGTFQYRIVVAEGEIRAGQRVERVAGEWQPPVALTPDEAARYTVDALLARVSRDARGEGPAPMDMFAIFDEFAGFPLIVETTALPTYTEDGKITLNRAASYTLSVTVDILLEDVIAAGKEPLLTLQRSGGADAWCSTLRIFADGASAYTDDCRQILLQLRPPQDRVAELQELAASLAPIDDSRAVGNAAERLILHGSGSNAPDPAAADRLWAIAAELDGLLSQPIGFGITLLRTQGNVILGYDMVSNLEQPASIVTSAPLHSALTIPAQDLLIYADAAGLHWLNLLTGETGLYFPNPDNLAIRIHTHLADGRLILSRPAKDSGSAEWGWVSLDDRAWHPLPAQANCITGTAAHPAEPLLLLTARDDNDFCRSAAALWLLNVDTGALTPLLAHSISAGDTTLPGSGYAPQWSPDGAWISLILRETDPASGEAHTRLYLLRPDGGQLIPITPNASGQISGALWSADGQLIYYAITGAAGQADGIYAYDAAGGTHLLELEGSNLTPLSLSPDGRHMAFSAAGRLHVWLIAFGQVVPVTLDASSPTEVIGWLDTNE